VGDMPKTGDANLTTTTSSLTSYFENALTLRLYPTFKGVDGIDEYPVFRSPNTLENFLFMFYKNICTMIFLSSCLASM
jgi:hypothetical protein